MILFQQAANRVHNIAPVGYSNAKSGPKFCPLYENSAKEDEERVKKAREDAVKEWHQLHPGFQEAKLNTIGDNKAELYAAKRALAQQRAKAKKEAKAQAALNKAKKVTPKVAARLAAQNDEDQILYALPMPKPKKQARGRARRKARR
ncbi:MAG: hypothetical protein EZS28_005491 [Streblomastix strix]|uniref:Uncharacterized protein n=1 Tax=Streblomastix strix TaxID=222440 RepID=A0A5J4WVG5_9EUKA|nr:MAG: hypothetical protein EZS28_005491 [Streblomastix strix]